MSATATLFYGYDLGRLITDPEDAWRPEENVYTVAPAWMREGEKIAEDWDEEEQIARALGWAEAPYPEHLAEQYPDPPYTGDYRRYEAERRERDNARRAHPDYLAWSASRDQMRTINREANLGVELRRYGVMDYETGLYIAVKESITKADYGCTAVPSPGVESIASWPRKLARFLELTELVPPRPVGWHVASYYG